jgi:hypothetical protein
MLAEPIISAILEGQSSKPAHAPYSAPYTATIIIALIPAFY